MKIFFRTYGKATIKQITDKSAIISIRSVFTGDPVPGFIPIPEELIKLIENNQNN